jgi:hypothetical protein
VKGKNMEEEKLMWEIGERKNVFGYSWECTEASIEDGIHYYVFHYIKANGKLGKTCQTYVGKRYDLKHIYGKSII